MSRTGSRPSRGPEVEDEARVAGEALRRRETPHLRDEPRLADAGIAAHVDDRAGAAGRAGMHDRRKLRQFAGATDERRRGAGVAAGDERVQPPRGDGPVDALDRKRFQHRARRLARDRSVNHVVQHDFAGSRDADKARGEIDRRPDHRISAMLVAAHAARDDLARRDADMHVERAADGRRESGIAR